MKRKALLYTLLLALTLLVGCSGRNTQTQDNASAAENAGAGTMAASGADNVSNATNKADTGNNGTTANGTSTDGMISEEEVRQIALSHAGLTDEHVTFVKTHIDNENGYDVYEVEFRTSDGREFDYEIDPYSGEILNYDYEAESVSGNDAAGDPISEAEAKELVLKHVPGATEQDITEFKTDHSNGRLQYEGKIYYEKNVYDFEIDAHSGEILEWDVEQKESDSAKNN